MSQNNSFFVLHFLRFPYKSLSVMQGGKRDNSGRKHKWFMGETVTIRIPLIFKDDAIALIREWDEQAKRQSEKLAKQISSKNNN